MRAHTGVIIALSIIFLWFAAMAVGLAVPMNWLSPWPYLLFLACTHLYTGLFISAHDAMHGILAPGRKKLNKALGTVAAFLFAYNWYNRLLPKHHEHHHYVATEKDPDYHASGHFGKWYLSFCKQYITWWQIVLMAITFNLLKLVFPQEQVIVFWMVPSILATLQLFYFGTYLPHRGQHAPGNIHKSRSQRRNHLWAFLSCYFFGYHFEHHDKPATPWWLLYRERDRNLAG